MQMMSLFADLMHQSNKEGDNLSDVTEDGKLSEAQLKRALDNLDLSHLLNGIRPFLDPFHKQRLDKVLADVFTSRAFNAVSKVRLPPNLTDYQTKFFSQRLGWLFAISYLCFFSQ